MLSPALLALAVLVLAVVPQGVQGRPITVGIVILPETGHLNPMLAMLEALSARGDRLTVFSPDFFAEKMTAMTARIPGVRVVGTGNYDHGKFNEQFFTNLVERSPTESLFEVDVLTKQYNVFSARALYAHFQRHPQDLPDVFVVDISVNFVGHVADAFQRPCVTLWPLTLSFPLAMNVWVPFFTFEYPLDMTFAQRLANMAMYYVAYGLSAATFPTAIENTFRAEIGLPPTDHFNAFYRRPIITPSVFGLDLAQPLCPNFFPVGLLQPTLAPEDKFIDSEWVAWLDACPRVVYINMGSIAVLPAWLDRELHAFVHRTTDNGTCVLWKRRYETADDKNSTYLLRVRNRLEFSPRVLLAHPKVSVFVTHCGDTSVYEAIEAHTPLVGIPLFADQPHVCGRVQDAGVGTFINKYEVTSDLLFRHVGNALKNNAAMRSRQEYLHASAQVQGMGPRAAEVVHLIQSLGVDEVSGLYCKHVDEPWYRYLDLDVMVAVSAFLWGLLFAVWWTIARCCGLCCRRRSTKKKVD